MKSFSCCQVVLVIALCAFAQAGNAADDQKETNKKRAALWKALLTALPKKYEKIDVYAENDLLNEVVFRSQGTTLTFSLKTGKVEPVLHMKAVFRVNRITFQRGELGGYYELWYSGRRELTIGAGG